MDILIRLGQFILMISLLVTLHELGHFIPAKLFKTKVEKFYLFFDPWFSLFKVKFGETVYGIGWLPMGGYVKIAGMIDESMDTEQMKQPPQPWEFRSKPAWQRLIIMLGGVVVNVLLAWVILTSVFLIKGEEYISVQKAQENGLLFSDVAKNIGFQDGDKIISVDGKKQEKFNRLILDIMLSDEILIDRNGQQVKIHLTDENIKEIISTVGKDNLIIPTSQGIVADSIFIGNNADKAGIKNGDIILTVNGKEFTGVNFPQEIGKYKNQTISLGILRDGVSKDIRTEISDSGKIGLRMGPNIFVNKHHNLSTAFPLAVKESFIGLGYNIKQFKILIKPKTEAYKQASGPLGIARKLPKEWDWHFFWTFSAMFSMWLAFLNVLPIPGLDGGHALLTIGEMITGRKLGEKSMGILQTIGMIILLTVMALIFGKDIYDWVQDKFVF